MAKARRPDVIEIDAEEITDAPVSEMVIKTIDTELKRFEPFEARLSELKEQYSGLTISGIEDKDGYENVRLAIADLRSIRTGTTKEKKAVKAPFLKACADIEVKAKFIIDGVTEIETPLQEKKDAIDSEKERIKAEKKKRQEEAFILRQAQLTQYGAVYQDGSFILEDVSYESTLLREADDEIYETMISQYKAIFDRKETERLEAERVAAEEKARIDAEKAELERQRKAQEEQAAALRAESERLERLRKEADEMRLHQRFAQLKQVRWELDGTVRAEYDLSVHVATQEQLIKWSNDEWHSVRDTHNAKVEEINEARRLADEKKAQEMEAQRKRELAEKEKQDKRVNQLFSLGLKFDFSQNHFFGFSVCVPSLDIQTFDDEKWDKTLEDISAHIQAFKEREEDARQAKAKADQEAAVATALAQEEEKRNAKKAEDERLAIEAAERLNASSDKAKWEHLASSLQAVAFPEFKSSQYRKKSNDLKTYLDSL